MLIVLILVSITRASQERRIFKKSFLYLRQQLFVTKFECGKLYGILPFLLQKWLLNTLIFPYKMEIHKDTTVLILTKKTYENPKHEAMEYSPFLEKMKWQFNLSLHWRQLTTEESGSSVYSAHILKWTLSLYHTVNKVYTFCENKAFPSKLIKFNINLI